MVTRRLSYLIAVFAVLATFGAVYAIVGPVNEYMRAQQPQPLRSPDSSSDKPTLTMSTSCTGPTCTIRGGYQIRGLTKAPNARGAYGYKNGGFIFNFAFNTYTTLLGAEGAVAPGSEVCLQTDSEGEVISMGAHFYDSPPIEFKPDGSVIAAIGDLIDASRDSRGLLAQFVSLQLTSSWGDQWRSFGQKKEADAQGFVPSAAEGSAPAQCSTDKNSFQARCLINASTSAERIVITLDRVLQPFAVSGINVPWKFTNEAYRSVMQASTVVDIDPSLPVTKCGDAVGTPTTETSPSPTDTSTPPPTPLTTAPPGESPAFAPAPSPTGGNAQGTPIFWDDSGAGAPTVQPGGTGETH